MKQIINRTPDNTVDLDSISFSNEDINFQSFWIAFKLMDEGYGYFVSDEKCIVIDHVMLGGQTFNDYNWTGLFIKLAITDLLKYGHEVYMFTNQKEFFTFLAKHSV